MSDITVTLVVLLLSIAALLAALLLQYLDALSSTVAPAHACHV